MQKRAYIKRSKIHVIRVPEREERENRTEAISEGDKDQ